MMDHVSIQCADMTASAAFYDAVLAPLGGRRVMDFGEAIGYGVPPKPDFWIGRQETGEGFRESHLAFSAPDRASVRAFFQAAVASGAEVLHEPRVWPEYHASYYGAFVRDPDGNNVEAVCHLPEQAAEELGPGARPPGRRTLVRPGPEWLPGPDLGGPGPHGRLTVLARWPGGQRAGNSFGAWLTGGVVSPGAHLRRADPCPRTDQEVRQRRSGGGHRLRPAPGRGFRLPGPERGRQVLDDADDRLRLAAERRRADDPRHGPADRRPGDQEQAGRGPAGGHARRRADRPGEHADLRPLLRPAEGGDRRADCPAAGFRSAHR